MRARAAGAAVSFGAQWTFNALVAGLFPILTYRYSTTAVLLGFSSMCAVAYAFTVAFVPETKGVPLEEMEALLKGGNANADGGRGAKK